MTRDRLLSARGVLVAVAAAVLVAGLAFTLTSGGGHRKAARPAPATSLTTTSLATPGLSWQTPDTVVASQSPVQVADDQQLAQESAQDPGLAQLEAMKVPAPAISGGWPRLAVANSPETWATEFVSGLSRHQLPRPVANGARPMAASRRGAPAHPRHPGQRRRQRAVRHRSRSRPGTDRRAAHRQRRRSGHPTLGRVFAKPSATCSPSPTRGGSS